MHHKIVIHGGKTLNGTIRTQGSKNAVLPILSAAVLTDGVCTIHNCPDISDVRNTMKILEYLGCSVCLSEGVLTLDATQMLGSGIPDLLMRKMRSSVLFLGALLSRNGYVELSMPGGCALGARPIDLHLKAFEQLGVKIHEVYGSYICYADALCPCEIYLDFPSVGATENIILLTCTANGTTVIHNAAKEPEILDLQNFLNCAGANISGAGTDTVTVCGCSGLHGVSYSVMPDRIAAATYLIGGAVTGGRITVTHMSSEALLSVLSVLDTCGFSTEVSDDTVTVLPNRRIQPIDVLRTMPYPGFPTDVQAIITPLLALADGTSIICENLFDGRYKHIAELCRMGADINVIGRNAVIKGVQQLHGAAVCTSDLRGAAGLVVAGLAARGVTVVSDAGYLYRGYEHFVQNLRRLGADVTEVE